MTFKVSVVQKDEMAEAILAELGTDGIEDAEALQACETDEELVAKMEEIGIDAEFFDGRIGC